MKKDRSLQYSRTAVLLVIFFGFILFGVVIVAAILWIPLFLVTLPVTVILYLISKHTKFGAPLNKLYLKTYDWLFYKSERPRKFLWKLTYNFMCYLYPQNQWKTINYGYAILNLDGKLIQNLQEKDEDDRYQLQMYHYLATQFNTVKNLENMNIAEVGSGRGGGLDYIRSYLRAKSCVGVDYSINQVMFCKSTYKGDNIKFFQGDAEHLDVIPDMKQNAFDMVVNIESSHCYGNFKAFIQQVHRILKPNGLFAFSDFRIPEEFIEVKNHFTKNPQTWKILKEEDITLNVIQSLKQDEARKTKMIENNVYSVLKPFFRKFGAVSGSRIYQEFQSRQTIYFAFIVQKVENKAI